MSKMTHTPGEFTADLEQCKVRNSGGGPIAAGLSNGCKSLEEMKANMNLFAAAPALLKALETLLEVECPYAATADDCDCDQREIGGLICDHMLAHRAIAKAKGGGK